MSTVTNLIEHAREVTERLHSEEPPFGLAFDEAICPACLMAFLVPATDRDLGVCPDCQAEVLERVATLIEESRP